MNDLQLQTRINEFNDTYGLGSLDLSKYTLGRTSFQLENFVINEHDCPERKFLQILVELKALRDGAIVDYLEQQKIKIQIKRLLATGDEIDALEATKKQYTLGTMQENMTHREREIKVLVNLLKRLPKTYTYDEIDAAEAGYWEKRLTRQMSEDMVSAQTGINQGNIRSIIQSNCSMGNHLFGYQKFLLDQVNPHMLSHQTQNNQNLNK